MADNRNASLGDMLRSVFLIGALLVGLAGLGYWFQVKPDRAVQPVDYVTALEAARGDADFDVLAPESLPKGWTATTVRYKTGGPGQWHLGVMTDKEEYIGIEQSALGTKPAIDRFSPDTEAKGVTEAGGHTWQLRQSESGETTLVRDEGDITIIVTGTAGRKVIEDYAASLTAD